MEVQVLSPTPIVPALLRPHPASRKRNRYFRTVIARFGSQITSAKRQFAGNALVRKAPDRPDRGRPDPARGQAVTIRLGAVKLLRPAQDFIRTESGAGLLLLAMVPIALYWANGPFADSYEDFWHTKASIGIGSAQLSLDLRHWVNEGLMAIFFFVVGLEIKRELVDGELSSMRKAATPALAALGGMLIPAALYIAFNRGAPELDGWAIPMATDIAIVLGILALLGKRVPPALKTFLLTLAIVDDIGAIVVIALFYAPHGISTTALGVAAAIIIFVFLLRTWGAKRGTEQPVALLLLSLAAWVAVYKAGIHATLAGVVLALLTPATPRVEFGDAEQERLLDVSTVARASESASLARSSVSTVEWLEHLLHPWSSYLVLPLFALANAGVALDADIGSLLSSSVALGIIAGLFIGKPLGITLFTLLATKGLKFQLPQGITIPMVAVASVLAGVGFTVSLFIADLAFKAPVLTSQAKAAVLSTSIAVGVIGFVTLFFALGKKSALPPGNRGIEVP